MFENYTFEMILENMLARVPDTIDKRQGSMIYNALAPAAVELQNMYINLDTILNETFADTASRENLIRRTAERGIIPYEAKKAIVKGEFSPAEVNIPIGSRFSLDELNYLVIEQVSDEEGQLIAGQYKLECEDAGATANYQFGQLIPIEFIEGLEFGEVTEILIPGEDEEGTDALRERYFESLDNQAFGGNISDYKKKTNELQGVGGVKVYPVWNGGGTVKLVIVNSDFAKPSEDLIENVQSAIDPVQNQGQGIGIAPIGHVVTVEAVEEEMLNISSNFTLQEGYEWADVEAEAQKVINDYFVELNATWADSENVIVRISQLETRLLNVSGVVDIANTEINGFEENFIAPVNSIVALGEVLQNA